MSMIRFDAGTAYHPAWTIRDETGIFINLSGAGVTLTVYQPSDPAILTPIPWMVKTIGNGLSMLYADNLSSYTVPCVVRADIYAADIIGKIGAFPYELKVKLPQSEERSVDKGFIVLLVRRQGG